MDKGVVAIIIGTVVVIGVIFAIAFNAPESKPELGQSYPILARDHVPVGSTHEPYNSNPPTSGQHYPDPAPWGVKTEELPDEVLVHNLEHGGIWISYNPDKADKTTIDALTQLTQRYPSKVILEPRKSTPTTIALASWGYLLTLDKYDEGTIRDFIARNKNKGPEYFPD